MLNCYLPLFIVKYTRYFDSPRREPRLALFNLRGSMTTQIVNLFLAVVTAALTFYNLKQVWNGEQSIGKIGRALGPYGSFALILAIFCMMVAGVVQLIVGGHKFLLNTSAVLNFIIAVDNFLNGNDPPKRRRRVWLKNKFAKLAPVRIP
jgi:hypothetical protein